MLITCFVIYLLLLVVLSKILSRRMSGLSDFFLAGQNLSGKSIAIAYVAAWFGAGSTIGTINEAYHHGLNAIWLIAVPTMISCILVWRYLAAQVREQECMSLPEAIESHYSPVGSFILAWIILATSTTFIASQLTAAMDLLALTTGFSEIWAVTMILAAVIIYSVIGGFRAVVMTDIAHFALYTLSLLMLLVLALFKSHNLQALSSIPSSFWNPFANLPQSLAITFTFVLAWCIAPEMWQRMSSTTAPEESKKSVLIAGGILMGLYAMVITIGMLAVFHIAPDDGEAGQNVLIAMAFKMPWDFLTAVVLVGVLSAICSTIDSTLNVATMTFTRDVVNRYFWPGASSETLVRVSRLATVLVGIPAAIIALHYRNIIQILWISGDIYASTMFIPVMAIFYAPNHGCWAGIWAMGLGAIPVILNFMGDFHLVHLPEWWPKWPFTTLLGVGLSLVGFILGALYHRYSGNHEAEDNTEVTGVAEAVVE